MRTIVASPRPPSGGAPPVRVWLCALFMLGVLITCPAPARAAHNCNGVAETIKNMETQVTEGWSEKLAGGQEDLARTSAEFAWRYFNAGPPIGDFKACLNKEGLIRFMAVFSKLNSLSATLEQTTKGIQPFVSFERDVVLKVAKPLQNVNPTYWRAINADMAKINRRYADVVQVEREAAILKRQTTLSVTQGHDAPAQSQRLATIDATPGPLALPSLPQTPIACAQPNVPATALRPAVPEVPPMAQQQGITGTVQVVVSLDADSRVTATRIRSSPSAILNAAALTAARQSTFQTEMRDCRPVPADYLMSIDFARK